LSMAGHACWGLARAMVWRVCDLFPLGGEILKARLTSGGGNSQTIASIILLSTSRMNPRGATLKPRLGSERGDNPSERGKVTVATVDCR
jgi:hypothetical protein